MRTREKKKRKEKMMMYYYVFALYSFSSLKKGYIKQFVLFATNRNIDTIGNSFIPSLNVSVLRNIKTASMTYIKILNENLNSRPDMKFNSNLISHFAICFSFTSLAFEIDSQAFCKSYTNTL